MRTRSIAAVTAAAALAACSSKSGGPADKPPTDPVGIGEPNPVGPPPIDASTDPVNTAAAPAEFWTLGEAACPDGAKLVGQPPPASSQVYCFLGGEMHGPSARWHEGTLIELTMWNRGKRDGL